MRTALTLIFILAFYCGVYSQDTSRIKQIDSLVSSINNSTFAIRRDTLIQNHPEVGLNITTYLSMMLNGSELLKYVNFVNSTMKQNAATRHLTSSNSFYYDHNQLIKVEEFIIEGDKKKTADWYYFEDKPLYYTLQSDQAADRASLLLTMSKAMLKQVSK